MTPLQDPGCWNPQMQNCRYGGTVYMGKADYKLCKDFRLRGELASLTSVLFKGQLYNVSYMISTLIQ